jgi:uncharacterized protein (DUF1800 family)
MATKIPRVCLRLLAASLVVCAWSAMAFAQDDPDPNSPSPILLTQNGSYRVITNQYAGIQTNRVDEVFEPNDVVTLYVKNVPLMKDEGASSFRTFVVDRNGTHYRFPVIDLQPAQGPRGTYVLTVKLTDEFGFNAPPTADGDIAIAVTWRGMISNFGKLGLGQTGGDIDPMIAALTANTSPAPPPPPIETKGTTRTLGSKKGAPSLVQAPNYVGYRWSGDRTRFMEQAAFGPERGLDNRIRRIGLRTWLAEQFAASYPTFPYPNQPLKPGTPPADCDGSSSTADVPATCYRDTYTMYPLQTWFMQEALYGNAQLRHRVAWALSQIWVNSGVGIQQSRQMVEYHKILSNNAFGNFRTLMGQMTLNPTMGDYLDMNRSTKNNPNENYAREIMQLFTIGLFMLNQDGTQQLDGTGNPIATYDQNGVNNLTKVLTGWVNCNSGCANSAVGIVNYIDPMVLVTGNHDTSAKTLLSYPGSTTTNIAACSNCTNATNITTYANNSMNQALDNIFNHPNVGPFIGKQLIQQLVTSDPTPAYVSRVAAVFNDNGFGVRGDMKAVVTAILLDPEARGDNKTDPDYGKLREPVQLATNILRHFNVRSAAGTGQSDGVLTGRSEFTGMGQLPFMSPTVFNYFPPDYIIPETTVLGPEFALMTTGTTIQRANFVNRLAFISPAVPVSANTNNGGSPLGTSLDFSDLQALSAADASGGQLVDELDRRMMHSTMSAQMRSTILTAVTNISSADPLNRSRQAVYLVATSSQYQVQR